MNVTIRHCPCEPARDDCGAPVAFEGVLGAVRWLQAERASLGILPPKAPQRVEINLKRERLTMILTFFTKERVQGEIHRRAPQLLRLRRLGLVDSGEEWSDPGPTDEPGCFFCGNPPHVFSPEVADKARRAEKVLPVVCAPCALDRSGAPTLVHLGLALDDIALAVLAYPDCWDSWFHTLSCSGEGC
jgi:hypothetical protein